ncbi:MULTISPECIES: dienelactone hydrolase family protein [unclassified Oceanobacter]|uniref:dienelactone hydrolase family protein n=1 Tax=unclassified Oceanobacter TaxID=2620260 RepID=UPI002734F5EE|nr:MULTISPECIES: dienelactone hydrolase family protein [unclassified Oceanobacter]MDP2610175.1 dienelactone hydrolase family protein [Oceanobacter sp. 1_MG-2023]MDP2613416.1 dienelactone hydrolase family protein [Oceanobacter sp. 2_MG-2023]
MTGTTIEITSPDGQFSGYLASSIDGKGPGLVLCQEIFGVNADMKAAADHLAEEGYTVLVPDLFWRQQAGLELTEADFEKALSLYQAFDENKGVDDIQSALATLAQRPECEGDLGVLGYCLGGKLAYLAGCRLPEVTCAVSYYGVGIEQSLADLEGLSGKLVLHMADNDQFCPAEAREQILAAVADNKQIHAFVYPDTEHAFGRVGSSHYNKSAALLAHERSIKYLRSTLGPDYDLEALWEEHIRHEFDTRDVPATMATMVAEPYVNHIPTMTGGVGSSQLARFYQYHFVHGNPQDMAMIPISRTVGASQVVDEFVMTFTHDSEIDWLVPGIKPTGRQVEIPMLGVVKFRGPKLYHEHIYWDQASVMVQLGLLNPDGLPTAGAATAHKLLDESLPSNTLMPSWASSANKTVD